MHIHKPSPWATAAMVCFALGIMADLGGLLLLFVSLYSLQDMNLITAAGQLKSATNVVGLAIIAFIIGCIAQGCGLFCLAAAH